MRFAYGDLMHINFEEFSPAECLHADVPGVCHVIRRADFFFGEPNLLIPRRPNQNVHMQADAPAREKITLKTNCHVCLKFDFGSKSTKDSDPKPNPQLSLSTCFVRYS